MPAGAAPTAGDLVSQQGLPLGKRIECVGGDIPFDGNPHQFVVGEVRVGSGSVPLDAVVYTTRSFAPGIYQKLTNDQKLSRPAFEDMHEAVGDAAAKPEEYTDRARASMAARCS